MDNLIQMFLNDKKLYKIKIKWRTYTMQKDLFQASKITTNV